MDISKSLFILAQEHRAIGASVPWCIDLHSYDEENDDTTYRMPALRVEQPTAKTPIIQKSISRKEQ